MPDFDMTILSLGGGLQSTTIAEMVVNDHLPMIDMAMFADTGNEPDYVYETIWYICGRLEAAGIPLRIVSGGDIIGDMMSDDCSFPTIPAFVKSGSGSSMLRRKCTSIYKIRPIHRAIREELLKRGLALEHKNGKIHPLRTNPATVKLWLGITYDEISRISKSTVSWITNDWPLARMRMTRDDCTKYLEERGLHIPGKSSCIICPYHSKKTWLDMKRDRPGDWDFATRFDESLRNGDVPSSDYVNDDPYLIRDLIPLRDLSGDKEEVEDQCGGFCFT